MDKYEVKVSKRVIKKIEKLPKKVIPKIYSAIVSLENDPRPSGCKKLKSYDNFWRIRIGNFRVIYSIEDAIRIVKIRNVADRKELY